MNKGKEGVILVSFGSITPTSIIDVEKKKAFYKTFEKYPDYHFIVKITEEDRSSRDLVENISNIDLVTWMPQSDILGKNAKH